MDTQTRLKIQQVRIYFMLLQVVIQLVIKVLKQLQVLIQDYQCMKVILHADGDDIHLLGVNESDLIHGWLSGSNNLQLAISGLSQWCKCTNEHEVAETHNVSSEAESSVLVADCNLSDYFFIIDARSLHLELSMNDDYNESTTHMIVLVGDDAFKKMEYK